MNTARITISFVIIFFILLYLDFGIISPLILPEDPCHYHFNETPFWVEFLYMNGGSNGHPEWSFSHIIILLSISLFLGFKSNGLIKKFFS